VGHFCSLACVGPASPRPFGNDEHGAHEAGHLAGFGDVLVNLGVARLPFALQHEPDISYPPLKKNALFLRTAAPLVDLHWRQYAAGLPLVQRSGGHTVSAADSESARDAIRYAALTRG
jgi:hypothetical protein